MIGNLNEVWTLLYSGGLQMNSNGRQQAELFRVPCSLVQLRYSTYKASKCYYSHRRASNNPDESRSTLGQTLGCRSLVGTKATAEDQVTVAGTCVGCCSNKAQS